MVKRRKNRPASAYAKTILIADGWLPWPVEQKIPMQKGSGSRAFFTRDAWGFADWMAFCPRRGFLFVQVTVEDRRADHAEAVQANEVARSITASAAARIELWSLSSRGPQGKQKLRVMRKEVLCAAPWRWMDVGLVPIAEAERARRQAEAEAKSPAKV